MKLLVVGLILLAMVFIAGCGPENLPGARPQIDAPSAVETTPILVDTLEEATLTGTAPPIIEPMATPESAALAESDTGLATSPLPTPIATAVVTDMIPIDLGASPISTPDLNEITVPELDAIELTNRQRIVLPASALPETFGRATWSSVGTQYLAMALGDESLMIDGSGRTLGDLYLGTLHASLVQPTLIFHNVNVPWWSRDGNSVYYLSVRSDGKRFYNDLYRLNLTSMASELIISDVFTPYFSSPAAQETTDGRLLTLDREHRPSLVTTVNGAEALTPLASILGLQEYEGTAGYVSLAPDGHTIAFMPSLGRQVEEGAMRSYVDRPSERPLIIADLAEYTIIDTLPGPVERFDDVAWTPDSKKLAYASYSGSDGVVVYDLAEKRLTSLITRDDLGFAQGDIRSSFSTPIWSPDQKVVLFNVGTRDWDGGYTFAATADGATWKAISRDGIEAISPDGAWALVYENGAYGTLTSYLAEMKWR